MLTPRSIGSRFFFTALLALQLMAQSESAAGQALLEEERGQASRAWIPAVSLLAGGIVSEPKGRVASVERGVDEGDSRIPVAFVGVGGEISTPALLEAVGRPRLFLRGDVAWSFDSDDGLVNRDDPGTPIVPPINNFPVLGVPGQGQAMRVAASPLVLAAGAGLSFSLDAFDRVLRVKPSVEWLWQRDEITVRFGHVEAEGPNPDFCAPCRVVAIDAQTEESFHSVGPGLEIEMETAHSEDLVFALFARAHAYRLVTDDRVRISATGNWTTEGAPSAGRAPSTLSGSYEREPWSYRFAVGLRVLWRPEP